MEKNKGDIQSKKRLMFIKGEDFYFLTYNILILLDLFGCTSENKRFKDYRKLAFLVDFVSDYNLVKIIQNQNNITLLHSIDRELLIRSYTNGLVRSSEIIKLIFALEKKGILGLYKDSNSNQLDIYMIKESLPADLFDSNIFKIEFANLINLKASVNRISGLKLETLLEKLFYNYGITKWAAY